MLGMIINEKELKELEYMIKKEMDELIFDLEDTRIDIIVKKAMYDRYQVLFQLFRRVATEQEVLKYIPNYKF
ncbi:hypothetical protein KQI76_07835 [Amphibacillus sp. MSJ-3]|uniref:hypothetical protein n=1 Tax=Amphibacillus sp. MSJ-3 TaxID=2841505 RepID=UPI001C0E9B35|nr:hypothetical protein [Amphibacillus sp. MSJ-3]MBU5595074.1 hypothetical protein [Amphibacillus sp. MSJ-3]